MAVVLLLEKKRITVPHKIPSAFKETDKRIAYGAFPPLQKAKHTFKENKIIA